MFRTFIQIFCICFLSIFISRLSFLYAQGIPDSIFNLSTTGDVNNHSNNKNNCSKCNDFQKTKINYLKTGIITGVTIGAGIWLHNYQKNAWWSGQRGKFHFKNDWDYAFSVDKFGHFFDGALIQSLYQGAFEWSGFSNELSMWLGAGFSVAYMTDIEIEDGFATDWGFSPGDELFNIMGSLYPVAQHYYELLQHFNIKWSYFPSDKLRSGEKQGAFLDDYDGQTNWLSINLRHFMSKPVQKYWPEFINIAIGYGVENYKDPKDSYQNFYFGLDYDLRKIIPGESKFMLWLKNIINHFRIIPAPALRFNKDGVKYILNF